MYLARSLLLGIEKELPRQQANHISEDGNQHNVLSLTALGKSVKQDIKPL